MSYEALNSRIMEMKDEILAGIQQNMRIESVRGEAQPDAPYGPGPKALYRLVIPAGLILPMVPRSTMESFGEEDVWMIRDLSLDRFMH